MSSLFCALLFLGPAAPLASPEAWPASAGQPVHGFAVPREPVMPAGFVGSGGIGVNFLSTYPIPSMEISLFLGGALPVAPRRPGHWVALGYRGTASFGLADVSPDRESFNLFTHRHQLAVQGVAGPRSRLAYGASLGVAVFALGSGGHSGHRQGVIAAELEGRIGYVVGKPAPNRSQGMFGFQLRLSARNPTLLSFPIVGLFFGFTFGRGLPVPPPRRAPATTANRHTEHNDPRCSPTPEHATPP